MAAALERAGVEPDQVGHVVMGTVLQAGQAMFSRARRRRGRACQSRSALRQATASADLDEELAIVGSGALQACGVRATWGD